MALIVALIVALVLLILLIILVILALVLLVLLLFGQFANKALLFYIKLMMPLALRELRCVDHHHSFKVGTVEGNTK